MADHFPLVATSNTIQELPSGDNLNLNQSKIVGVTSVSSIAIDSSTVLITGTQSGIEAAPFKVTAGGAFFQGPVGIGTTGPVGKSEAVDQGSDIGGTTSGFVLETRGGIVVRDKNVVGLASTSVYLLAESSVPRLELYDDGKYAATVAYRGEKGAGGPNFPQGGNKMLEIRTGTAMGPINITTGSNSSNTPGQTVGTFPRIRIENDGRIAMGSSLGLSTDFHIKIASGFGTTAFSRSSGILQIFSSPDGRGDNFNEINTLPNNSSFSIPTLGISSIPILSGNIYTWKFQEKHGPYGFARSLVGCLYNVDAVGVGTTANGGLGDGAGFELGSNPQNNKGAWLSLGGAARGDGQENVIALSNGPTGAYAERFRISSAGNVGIATSTPTNKLHLVGGFTFQNRGSASTQTALHINTSTGEVVETASSRKYKRDIEDYTKGLETVLQLRPVSFKYQDDENPNAGLIAEEVDELGLSEFVRYDAENAPHSIPYENLTALLINAIQELNEKVLELSDENQELKGRLDAAGI